MFKTSTKNFLPMKQHLYILLKLFVVIVFTSQLEAKPLRIVVEDIIGSSKFTGQVVITGYDGKGKIFFTSTDYKDTISIAKVGQPLVNGTNSEKKAADNYLTENYPLIGDTVLIVVNENDLIRVFGKRIKTDYRLWSPLISGSIAIFEYATPLKPIDSSMVLGTKGTTESCWDGCLLPIEITQRLIATYRQKFNSKLNSIQLKSFVGQTVQTVFYNDTLRLYNDLIWSDEPPGKLRSLLITYSTGQTLEIIPENNTNHAIQFDSNRKFSLDEFKKCVIKEVKWLE